MTKHTHAPPSRLRYEKDHPVVSIRVSRDLYDQLEELREMSGKSLGDILREACQTQAPSAKGAYQHGYEAAKGTFAVQYKCSVCGGDLIVSSDQERTAIAGYMKEHRWGHARCVHQKK